MHPHAGLEAATPRPAAQRKTGVSPHAGYNVRQVRRTLFFTYVILGVDLKAERRQLLGTRSASQRALAFQTKHRDVGKGAG